MTGALHVGSSGAGVVRLKARLRALRYAVDGGATFTAATHHAFYWVRFARMYRL